MDNFGIILDNLKSICIDDDRYFVFLSSFDDMGNSSVYEGVMVEIRIDDENM